MRQIDECLPSAYKIHLTTHEKLSSASFRLQRSVAFNVACGTNLLHSHMEFIKQWNVGLLASWRMKPCGAAGSRLARASEAEDDLVHQAVLAVALLSISTVLAISTPSSRLKKLAFPTR